MTQARVRAGTACAIIKQCLKKSLSERDVVGLLRCIRSDTQVVHVEAAPSAGYVNAAKSAKKPPWKGRTWCEQRHIEEAGD